MIKMTSILKSALLLLIALAIGLPLIPVVFVARLMRDAINGGDVAAYLKTCALGIDQLGGSVLYNEEDFTVSSMTYEKAVGGNVYAAGFMHLIDFLARILGDEENHCKNSYFNEIQKIKAIAAGNV